MRENDFRGSSDLEGGDLAVTLSGLALAFKKIFTLGRAK
jgi:hypothetical protein